MLKGFASMTVIPVLDSALNTLAPVITGGLKSKKMLAVLLIAVPASIGKRGRIRKETKP